LRNQPGFAALAVLTLALGIGATTTMYSVIYNVLFDPFPYKDSERVVTFQIRPGRTRRPPAVARFFKGPSGSTTWNRITSTRMSSRRPRGHPDDHPRRERCSSTAASSRTTCSRSSACPHFYGRVLTPEDAKAGAHAVFVMAYKMWTKHYNFDPPSSAAASSSTAFHHLRSGSCRGGSPK
jgi:hypothetical protein